MQSMFMHLNHAAVASYFGKTDGLIGFNKNNIGLL